MKNITNEEYFIDSFSLIKSVDIASTTKRQCNSDKNICPSKEIAEGILALMQLIQLRDYYNNGWKQTGNCFVIYITNYSNPWIGEMTVYSTTPFTFKSADLAKEFLNNFKDLLEKVKYLF